MTLPSRSACRHHPRMWPTRSLGSDLTIRGRVPKPQSFHHPRPARPPGPSAPTPPLFPPLSPLRLTLHLSSPGPGLLQDLVIRVWHPLPCSFPLLLPFFSTSSSFTPPLLSLFLFPCPFQIDSFIHSFVRSFVHFIVTKGLHWVKHK